MESIKRFLIFALGIFLLVVGVAGLILPILPGWVLIFMGLSIVAPRAAKRLKGWVFKKRFKHDLAYFSEWEKLGVQSGCTTRHFPVHLSGSADLMSKDTQTRFLEAFWAGQESVGRHLQTADRFVLLRQVHKDRIAVLDDEEHFRKPGFYPQEGADGAITRLKGLTLLVFTADCLPVYFSAGDWVGLAHAGWRGTKACISEKMLKLISEKSGVPASKVKVIFGPRIGPDNYEVGEEFTGHFPDSPLLRLGGKLYFDLGAANRRQLIRSGLKPGNILDPAVCTVDQNEDFYSFRKEGEKAGRMVSFITKV